MAPPVSENQWSREPDDNNWHRSNPLPVAVGVTLNAIADIAVVLAVIPLLIFTGPTQTDTASGASLPLIVLAISPIFGWMMTRAIPGSQWLFLAGLMRISLAAVLIYSPGLPFLSSSFLSIVMAISIAMRIQEVVVLAAAQTRSRLLNAISFAIPAVALLALLKFYSAAQPFLLTGAIALYSMALIAAMARSLSREATISDTAPGGGTFKWSLDTMPGLTAYEITLSCIAGMVGVVPVILSLTDQSTILPVLRTDVVCSLCGWLLGTTLVSMHRIETRLKLEHLHLLFTVLLGALSFCKTTSIAYALLFLTSAISAAVSFRIAGSNSPAHRPSWQPAVALSALIVASAFAYVDLSPKLCALQPIHVDRTLAAMCFIPSIIAVFFWRDTRKMILKLIAYLVPVHNPLSQTFSFYFTKNMELTKAIMVGWRLNTTIIVITREDSINTFVTAPLRLGNIYVSGFTQWSTAHDRICRRMADGERFLVFNFTGFDLEKISPLPPNSTVGLVETIDEINQIVISDMVLSQNTPLSGILR